MESSQIKEVLQSLGYKLSDRGSYWQTNAVFRNGNNQTALQIYKDTGVWKDYVEGTSFSPLKRLIEVTLGTNDAKVVGEYLKKDDASNLYTRKTNVAPKIEMEETYPTDCLERLLPHYKFYDDKGISTEILKSLKGGLATTGQLNQRFVFPIFNEFKQIHGFSGRDMKNLDDSNRPKWKHIGKKKDWIYPYYILEEEVLSSIQEKGYVIIVESIGDLLSLHQNGYKNCLVSFGLTISSKLACAIVSMDPDHVIISFNNDTSSQENRGLDASFKNYLKMLSVFDPHSVKICLPTKNDFGDMDSEDFNQWDKKVAKIKDLDQSQIITENCNRLLKSGALSKNLHSKLKLIK